MKTISDLMQRTVTTVDLDDPVVKVEQVLTEARLSWVPVRSSGGPVLGVISLSDLEHFHAQGRDPTSVPAWQVCTYKPIAVHPDDPVGAVARQMVDRHVHHVVVMDGVQLVGVVSALDFVRRFAQQEAG